MKNTFTAGAALLLTTSIVNAGGIERSVPSVGLLFETGNYLEFNLGYVAPDISGTQAIPPAGAKSGDIAEDYTQLSFGYKNDLTEELSFAIILDQPIGADVKYSDDTDYIFGSGNGSTATIESLGLTALLNYTLPNDISVYGGVRAIQTSGEVALFSGYEMDSSTETDFGYVVGAGWERPDIAARITITYQSELTHDFDADENGASTEFSTIVPQSLTLEGQTGVAADTLVFGSVRWVEWSKFDISPTNFGVATGGDSLVDYEDDIVTYNIGVGRRFNDAWSGAVTGGYEAEQGGFSGNLGPTDGNTSLGVALTHTIDSVRITGGLRYIWIGDTETEASGAPGTTLAEFEDNSGWAGGIRIAYNF